MTLSRRTTLGLGVGLAVAGMTAVAGPATRSAGAAVNALQEAHSAESSARAAYGLLLESGRLPPMILEVAERIYYRHRAAEEALARRAGALGSASLDQPSVRSAIDALQTPADGLRVMRDIEARTLSTYLSPLDADEEEAQLLAAGAADCAMNWALINHALGEPLPAESLVAGGSLPSSGAL